MTDQSQRPDGEAAPTFFSPSSQGSRCHTWSPTLSHQVGYPSSRPSDLLCLWIQSGQTTELCLTTPPIGISANPIDAVTNQGVLVLARPQFIRFRPPRWPCGLMLLRRAQPNAVGCEIKHLVGTGHIYVQPPRLTLVISYDRPL